MDLHLQHPTTAFFLDPFYNRAAFNTGGLLRGTSIAVLTYIGFDGISTLTDEAKDPSRSVPRAIVLTCFITGILSSIEMYVAQLVWTRGTEFPDITTGLYRLCIWSDGRSDPPAHRQCLSDVGQHEFLHGLAIRRGSPALRHGQGWSAARPLLRGRTSEKLYFRNNVLLIGAICLVGALILSYDLGAELLNYGALLAFMGVNASSILRGWRHGRWTQWVPMLISLAGMVTCFILWINLGPLAKWVGSGWALVGVLLWLARRRYTVLPGEAV